MSLLAARGRRHRINVSANIFAAVRRVPRCRRPRMSAMFACPRCGAPNSPGNLFSWNCGLVLAGSVQPAAIPAPYPPMWPPAPRSTSNLTAVLVVLVIVILVALAGVAAVFLGRQIQVPSPSAARAVGVFVARSADGTNWTLTITSARTALSPSAAKLSIVTSLGASALAPTPFVSLNYISDKAAYFQSQPGGPVAVGHRLLISTTAHPMGCLYRVSDSISGLPVAAVQQSGP